MTRWYKNINKYRNTPTVIDGIRFHSKREGAYYQELLMMKRVGLIDRIELQPKFKFPMGFAYIADFTVYHKDGTIETIDIKGFETPVFKLKLKCMKHFFPDVNLRIVK